MSERSKLFAESALTRRGFVKGIAALGAGSALAGCSKSDENGVAYVDGELFNPVTPPAIEEEYVPVTSGHNCGGRCPSTALVKNGRIHRIVADEHPEPDIAVGIGQQMRSCVRCRAYKGRLNSLGRIKYPMKQMNERGDMSGFMRITWDQAAKEIAKKIWDTMKDPYGGPQAIWPNIATANGGTIGGRTPFDSFLNGYCGGTTNRKYNYSSAQRGYVSQFTGIGSSEFALKYSSMMFARNIVYWGTHDVATRNQAAWPLVQVSEEVRKKGGKIYYIGPMMEDTCAALADEWIPIKPGTDGALAIAIMYEIVETADLVVKAEREAFIKKVSYGFYPSVGYWINEEGDKVVVHPASGGTVIALTDDGEYDLTNHDDDGSLDPTTASVSPVTGNWEYVPGVPAGYSFHDYLKGTWTYVTRTSSNRYLYKNYLSGVKDAAWAEAITGVSAAKIKELAEVYGGSDPVFSNRSNGEQRRYGGVYQDFATDILVLISGQWGRPGAGLHLLTSASGTGVVPGTGGMAPSYINHCSEYGNFKSPAYHAASIWHAIARMPGFDDSGEVFANDGDVAARYVIERRTDWVPFSNENPFVRYSDEARTTVDNTNGTYYKIITDSSGKPVKTQGRIIFNCGGGMLGNQHMNTFLNDIWLRDRSIWDTIVVFESHMSPTARYGDYILPEATNMEREDVFTGEGAVIMTSVAQNPPGEAITEYEFALMLAKELGSLDGVGSKYVETYGQGRTARQWLRHGWQNGAMSTIKDINGKTYTYEEARQMGIIKYGDLNPSTPARAALRDALDEGKKITPFNSAGNGVKGKVFDIDKTPLEGREHFGGKYPVFCWNIPTEYTTRGKVVWGSHPDGFSIQDIDSEGDKFAMPIPLYVPADEYKIISKTLEGATQYGSDTSKDPLIVLCTHDRYRSHSTHNENILLRELYKYSETSFDENGVRMLADDADTYCVLQNADAEFGEVAPIGGDGLSAFWINKRDAEARGINHMDVIRAFNGVGAVKAVAYVSNRIVPGVCWLSQGSWTDFRMVDGKKLDVGGNVNSITSEWPSKVDNNNAQMDVWAYVEKM